MLDIGKIKKQFPIFSSRPSLVYLDSAATSLKPKSVIDVINGYYKDYSANIHRGIYDLSEKSTEEYESTRRIMALFLGADDPKEIIFTHGTTEGLNLLASSLSSIYINPGDEIITTVMEHHANFVPWQQVAFRENAVLKVLDISRDYTLNIFNQSSKSQKISLSKDFDKLITKKTKILSIVLVSNTLGTVNPVKEIIKRAKKINPKIITIVDAAQAAPHMKINVQDLGCDFLAFSGHKMLGATGVGVLWGKKNLLDKMPPYQLGGDMIKKVTLEKTTFAETPHKFEAGTPHIAGVISLKEAAAQLEYFGLEEIKNHCFSLAELAVTELIKNFGKKVSIYRPKQSIYRSGIVSFNIEGIHPHDAAQILNEDNICVRAGHHCTMPLHQVLEIPASIRASFYLYNNEEDVHKLIKSLKRAEEVFK